MFNKLVRDKIPEIIKADNRLPITRIATDSEYWKKLKAKLQEEVEEVLEDTNVEEELADLLEVIHGILNYRGTTFQELEDLRLKKLKERGGYSDRIILEEVK